MGLRERMYELTAVEEVDEFLERFPTGAFFKAGSCHKTMQGFGYVEKALDPREEIHVGFVRVIESRPVSNYIAEITRIVHQSPQLILLNTGKAVYDVDNWNITPQALDEALNRLFGKITPRSTIKKESHSGKQADVVPYVILLQRLLKGELSEKDFQNQWLITFQNDATPRSIEQFNQLNSLFGDVDAALKTKDLKVTKGDSILKERAEHLLKILNT